MAEDITFENGQISNFKGLVTLTLERGILHTIVHYSSTSTCMPNFLEIKVTFCGRTYVLTYMYIRTDGHLRPALLGRLCREGRPNNVSDEKRIMGHSVLNLKMELRHNVDVDAFIRPDMTLTLDLQNLNTER